MKFLSSLISLGVATLTAGVLGQAPASNAPRFDVASVKPHPSAQDRSSIFAESSGRVVGTSVSARELVAYAYRRQSFLVIGGPSWIDKERFDILAKAPRPFDRPPTQDVGAMTRTLLAERFALVAHAETRDLPTYALVIARKDGILGPHLRRSTVDCVEFSKSPARGIPPTPGGPVTCGRMSGSGFLSIGGQLLNQLTAFLEPMVGRTVQDKTGLSGRFDFELKWSPALSPALPTAASTQPTNTDDDAFLFSALQEQLGLKLESQRGAGQVIVIDRIERPTEN